MNIYLNNISKQYNDEYIFKNINYVFEYKNTYAIIGDNGSGKSTLCNIIIGYTNSSKGFIQYYNHLSKYHYDIREIYKYITIVSSSCKLLNFLSLKELIEFHSKFKPLKSLDKIYNDLEECNISSYYNTLINNMSDGTKQKIKLILAINSETPLIILDEPTIYLDYNGINWYNNNIINIINNNLLIICSNKKEEYKFCKKILKLNNNSIDI